MKAAASSTKPAEPPDWPLIRAFVAVMESGTLSGAARRLGSTQPTLGRQIRALERQTGDLLFLRRGLRLEPTDRARDLFPRALDVERAVTSLSHAFAADAGGEQTRRVRLTLPTLLADEMLPRLLPRLFASAPHAAFDVAPSDLISDLHHRDADIALRMVRPTQPELIARRLGSAAIGLYASREYLAAHALPETAAALAGHRLIVPADEATIRDGLARLGQADAPPAQLIRSDDLRHRLALARAGLGITTCHDWIAHADPRLVRVLPAVELAVLELWLVATDDVRRSRTLRLVFDALPELVREVLVRD